MRYIHLLAASAAVGAVMTAPTAADAAKRWM